MEANEQTPNPQNNLMDAVLDLMAKVKSKFDFQLNKPAGVKYSIVQDLVLWLNVRGNMKFGQICRSAPSVKSRKVVLKELNEKHIKEIEVAFNKGVDLNKYQMIYPRNKIYSIEEGNDKSEKVEKGQKLEQKKSSYSSAKTNAEGKKGQMINDFDPQVKGYEQKEEQPNNLSPTRVQEPVILRVPNIFVCFIKDGKIGFLQSQRVRELCNEYNVPTKKMSDNELRNMFVEIMNQNHNDVLVEEPK